jgi:hypothetical protein
MRPPRTLERRHTLLAVLAGVSVTLSPVSARAADEPAPGSGGAVRIAAEPCRLVLGKDGEADLRIWVPPETEDLTVSASAGRVENVRRLPGGGWAARYRPPPERIPQVAFIVALARTPKGVADGWLAVPLSGQGDARVRATPGAAITLRVGDRTFGPSTADEAGVAVIPVVVPPGVREAHHGFRPVDLNVPETPLLHAIADRTAVHADRLEQVRVLAYVVAPHGAARRGDVPVFEPSRGRVSVSPREPGAFEVSWHLPPGTAGEDRLVVRLPGSPASRTVLRLDAAAGPPSTIEVAFDRAALVAGEGENVVVTARVLDAGGNVVPAAVELEADTGALSTPAQAAPGVVTARLEVAPAFGARRRVLVTARAPAVGITGSRTLALVPGRAAAVTFAEDAAVVRGGAGAEALLRVSVRDRFGNPVEAAPAVVAERGRVVAVEAEAPGAYRVRYAPPEVDSATEERVSAEVSGIRATAELLVVPPRRAASLAVAGGVGVDGRDRFRAATLGVTLEVPSGVPLPLASAFSLAWRADAQGFGWSWRSAALDPPGRAGDEASTARGVALLGGATVQRELRHGGQLWAGVGVGVATVQVDVTGAASRSGVAPAARLAAGLGVQLGRATPFVEAAVLAAGDTPAGAFAAFGVSAGVRFDTWRRRHGDDPDRR